MIRNTMRKLFYSGALAAALLPAVALADSSQGRIETIDENSNTLTLSDGNTYQLPGEFDYSVIKEGMRVTILYDKDGKNRYITDIEPEEKPGVTVE